MTTERDLMRAGYPPHAHSYRSPAQKMADLEAKLRLAMEALGAHAQADAYADNFPDDEQDASYLRHQEAHWRGKAAGWAGNALYAECADLAKARRAAEPDVQTVIAELRSLIAEA